VGGGTLGETGRQERHIEPARYSGMGWDGNEPSHPDFCGYHHRRGTKLLARNQRIYIAQNRDATPIDQTDLLLLGEDHLHLVVGELSSYDAICCEVLHNQ
jgi:hypothetical protein